jgi:hypothetical protein
LYPAVLADADRTGGDWDRRTKASLTRWGECGAGSLIVADTSIMPLVPSPADNLTTITIGQHIARRAFGVTLRLHVTPRQTDVEHVPLVSSFMCTDAPTQNGLGADSVASVERVQQ